MQLLIQAFLLFSLNLIDAVLTIYWVRNGHATEGNSLMAYFLDMGDLPFLVVKIAVGAIAAIVFWRWSNLRVAKYGLTFALFVYIGLMGVHIFTGLSVFGLLSENFINEVAVITDSVSTFFV